MYIRVLKVVSKTSVVAVYLCIDKFFFMFVLASCVQFVSEVVAAKLFGEGYGER